MVARLSPGFYLRPDGVEDLVDFMAGKMLDLLGGWSMSWKRSGGDAGV